MYTKNSLLPFPHNLGFVMPLPHLHNKKKAFTPHIYDFLFCIAIPLIWIFHLNVHHYQSRWAFYIDVMISTTTIVCF